jgi:tetratricopeptide (TPR) repeat protein
MMDKLLLDRYQLEAELGSGGMGVVYRARDNLLERDVAVKLLSTGSTGSQGHSRLLEEARSAARLNHPNIVSIYDVGEADGTPFIIMEFVEGKTLEADKPETIGEVVLIARQLCAALEHAHSYGIIHRDLKPENVIITPNGTPKLMDFGLARSVASRLSEERGISGTVYYMAPELLLGQKFDGRADLYALGAVLYELLTQQLPFSADDPLAVISQHLYAPVVPPQVHRPDILKTLNDLIIRLLSKQPQDRPSSAREVARLLEQVDFPGDGPVVEAGTNIQLPLLDRLIRGRFIGRDVELKALRQRWGIAQEGQGHLVLISGEPGIGKSRLANEIIAYARLHGAYVLQGGSYEYETKMPYLPFVEGLRDWVHDQPPEVIRDRLAHTAVELTKLAPEIEAKLGPLEPNPPLTPDQERLRLFDNISRFLQNLATEKGLLVFFDDLHWADQSTLSLLHYLLRRLNADRVLFLGAYREIELDRKHPLSAALVDLNRERLVTRIQLKRFTEQECSTLLATMFGQEQITDEFSQAIYRETEGNPFFIEEVAKALVEQGQIYLEEGQWEREAIHELIVPQSIKEAIGRRLDRLNPECIEVLQSAAVIGKDFEFSHLAAVVDLDEDLLLDFLDEANRAQLVEATSGEKFVFTHDKIREVLYEELNPIRQRRLHRRIMGVIEELYADQVKEHIADLAYHAVLGGELEKGLGYSTQAGEEAFRVFAHEEALNFYQNARDCAVSLDSNERLAAIDETIGDIYLDRGHIDRAVESYERALSKSESFETKARLKGKIGSAYTSVGDERSLDYLDAALEELDPESQRDELAHSLAMMARNYHYRAQYDRSIEYLERAREMAEPGGNALILSDIYGYLSGSYQHTGRYKDSNFWAEKNISWGEEKEYPAATAIGHEFLAENAILQGDWHTVLHHADLDHRLGVRIGALSRIAWSGFGKLGGYRGLGNLEAAKSEGWSKIKIAEDIGERRLVVWIKSFLALVETDLAEDQAALELVKSAVDLANEQGEPALISVSCLAQGYYYLQRGEWGRALQFLDSQEVIQSRRHSLGLFPETWAVYAESLLSSGDLDESQKLAEQLLAQTRKRGEHHLEALATRIRGQIFARQERWDQAFEAYRDAIEQFNRLGSKLELGRAFYHRSLLYQERGEKEKAAQDSSRALGIFVETGARRDAERAAAIMTNTAPNPAA